MTERRRDEAVRVVVIAPGDGRPDVAAPIDYAPGFPRHGMQAQDGKGPKVSTRPESRCYPEPPPTPSDQPDALDDAFAQEASVRSVAASGPTASPATLGLVLPKRLAEKVLPPVVGKAP